ncbi:hypothetical protein PIB30_054534 [Stylosanthes scabra]|uniref:RNase H type-1 domain-containing protein n=1 Tax=Stylosanthes scabra TaxID=79078 RepID=A0ABU6YG84_9FABA|nr:hypothetical protein [Stylosanthes scabra]
MDKNGHKKVLYETDSLETYLYAQRHLNNNNVANSDLIEKIRDLLTRNWWAEVPLIQRTTNDVADAMAKEAGRYSLPHVELLSPGSHLLPVLRQDLSAPSF